jgi:hypothetical protein
MGEWRECREMEDQREESREERGVKGEGKW